MEHKHYSTLDIYMYMCVCIHYMYIYTYLKHMYDIYIQSYITPTSIKHLLNKRKTNKQKNSDMFKFPELKVWYQHQCQPILYVLTYICHKSTVKSVENKKRNSWNEKKWPATRWFLCNFLREYKKSRHPK